MDRAPTVTFWLLMSIVFSLLRVSVGQRDPTSSQIQEVSGTDEVEGYRNYTPRPITPQEVNCYLEMQQTRVLGGRCVPLGRERVIWSCQSGIYIHPNNRECQELASRSQTRHPMNVTRHPMNVTRRHRNRRPRTTAAP